MNFKLGTELSPSGDQPQAIKEIVEKFRRGEKNQVLLGATGTGKTFTMANIIQQLQKPTLILAHNKTLAMQLCAEMKSFFCENKVEYYVSFFDYYRPEAYKPHNDVYLEKRTQRNAGIEKMRMSALNSLATESSVVVIASVASIYGCLDPYRYREAIITISLGQRVVREEFLKELSDIGYNSEKKNLTIRNLAKIAIIDIDREEDWFFEIKLSLADSTIESLAKIRKESSEKLTPTEIAIPPVQYIIEKDERIKQIIKQIEEDLAIQKDSLVLEGKSSEARRLEKRVSDDLLDLKEFGFCNGVENYSFYFDRRKTGESPFVLFDFFPRGNYLTIVDESHITIPQVRAMYNTDRNRKKTLVEHGFRLPSALDNRPLSFEEFLCRLDDVLYVSATPGSFELDRVGNKLTEQIIRPTGLLDPVIEVRSSYNQVLDMLKEIRKASACGEKVLVYALTIGMSEDIASYFQEQGVKAVFIHSRMNVFERYQAISSLRRGFYDVIVGINLLKEGIDLPEVSLVCIIDADKPGFLRDTRSLIQIVGRAARNQNGKVIFYASQRSKDMNEAIKETERRRSIQLQHNLENNISPRTIEKGIKNVLLEADVTELLNQFKEGKLDQPSREKGLKSIVKRMEKAVKEFKFDKAIELRNALFDLRALNEQGVPQEGRDH